MSRYRYLLGDSRGEAARRTAAAWRAAARRPESLFVAPAVIDAVARRPRG